MEKQSTFKAIVAALLVAVVIIAIFLFSGNKEQEVEIVVDFNEGEGEVTVEPLDNLELDEVLASGYQGEVLAGSNSFFLDFNQEDYEAAIESGKTVFLYFYAKWCPSCKRELRDATEPAFNAYEGNNIVGFRVNYNDRDTDDYEDALAGEFGVLYQHTKVFISGEDVQTFPNTWSLEEYLDFFEAL